MKRTAIAASIVLGITVPAIAATLFIFGCCVLPFHKVIHSVAPLCTIAAGMMTGQHDAGPQQTPVPAPEKQSHTLKFSTELTAHYPAVNPAVPHRSLVSADRRGLRDQVTLGALRCDQDVGYDVLLQTFRI
jgi:hypothetical protein